MRHTATQHGKGRTYEMTMERIATKERALRLARTIVGDIRLYNADAVAAKRDLTAEVAEGRTLFHQRTLPELHPLYEEIVASAGLVDHSRPQGGSSEMDNLVSFLDDGPTNVGIDSNLIEQIREENKQQTAAVHAAETKIHEIPTSSRFFDKDRQELTPASGTPIGDRATPVPSAPQETAGVGTMPDSVPGTLSENAPVADAHSDVPTTPAPNHPAVSPLKAIIEKKAHEKTASPEQPAATPEAELSDAPAVPKSEPDVPEQMKFTLINEPRPPEQTQITFIPEAEMSVPEQTTAPEQTEAVSMPEPVAAQTPTPPAMIPGSLPQNSSGAASQLTTPSYPPSAYSDTEGAFTNQMPGPMPQNGGTPSPPMQAQSTPMPASIFGQNAPVESQAPNMSSAFPSNPQMSSSTHPTPLPMSSAQVMSNWDDDDDEFEEKSGMDKMMFVLLGILVLFCLSAWVIWFFLA